MADNVIINDLIKLEGVLPELKAAFALEAVNHFTESFDNQGFEGDNGLEKWADVKRRNPNSAWFGFHYGGKQRKPSNHPSRKNTKQPYKKRKKSPITNYKKSATRTPILSSQRSQLENAIHYRINGTDIIVYNEKEYASIQNNGGQISVFGRKKTRLKPRKFIGNSKSLERKLRAAGNQIFKSKLK